MRFSRFFIDRPILSGVISVFITLLGLFFFPQLPLAQYPADLHAGVLRGVPADFGAASGAQAQA